MEPSPVLLDTSEPAIHRLHLGLTGCGHGEFYNPQRVDADFGTTYKLHGWGQLSDLGYVAVSGTVTVVGVGQTGKATGTLTFLKASGSITVVLDGSVQPGTMGLPNYLHYQVVEGTWDYRHFHGEGTLRLDFYVDPSAASKTQPHGSFRLKI
jgi:hypothetical protein